MPPHQLPELEPDVQGLSLDELCTSDGVKLSLQCCGTLAQCLDLQG